MRHLIEGQTHSRMPRVKLTLDCRFQIFCHVPLFYVFFVGLLPSLVEFIIRHSPRVCSFTTCKMQQRTDHDSYISNQENQMPPHFQIISSIITLCFQICFCCLDSDWFCFLLHQIRVTHWDSIIQSHHNSQHKAKITFQSLSFCFCFLFFFKEKVCLFLYY